MGCKRASQHSLPESHQPQPAPPPPPMPDVHMSSLLPTQPVASPPQQQQELMEERPDRLRDELFAEKEGRVSECMILSVAVAISALVGWRARPGAVGMRLSSRTKLSERNNHLGRFYMFDLTQLTDSSPDPAKYAENLERMRAELTALIAALTASLGLHSGILVTTLIIIERMLRQGFPLSVETVRPTALTAILIACKEGFDEVRGQRSAPAAEPLWRAFIARSRPCSPTHICRWCYAAISAADSHT
eukprot:scaffold256016_cov28-Tisochrysis_lutea.AAC.1